jgi:hypothetical protein
MLPALLRRVKQFRDQVLEPAARPRDRHVENSCQQSFQPVEAHLEVGFDGSQTSGQGRIETIDQQARCGREDECSRAEDIRRGIVEAPHEWH